jgi:pyruvate/2-oxoglutarate dehydrogenase complex dihydrolipoamide acyltransferase (E2) component
MGIGAIQKRIVAIEDIIEIRPMVYISLTFDYRIIDGAYADKFLMKVKNQLEQWT